MDALWKLRQRSSSVHYPKPAPIKENEMRALAEEILRDVGVLYDKFTSLAGQANPEEWGKLAEFMVSIQKDKDWPYCPFCDTAMAKFTTAYPSHVEMSPDGCCGFFQPRNGKLICNECGIDINEAINSLLKKEESGG